MVKTSWREPLRDRQASRVRLPDTWEMEQFDGDRQASVKPPARTLQRLLASGPALSGCRVVHRSAGSLASK